MARDLNIDIYTQAHLDGLDNAALGLDQTARSADKTGSSFRNMKQDAETLNKTIAVTKTKVQELNAEFAKSGGSDKSIFGDLKKERSFLAELERIKRELSKDQGWALALGSNAGAGFGDGFLSALSATPLRTKAIAALVAVGVAASPALGAAVAGAVTGAVGLGGIAGGIAAASKDPQIRMAAKHFSTTISKEFFSSGSAFVEPTVAALDILEKAFQDLDLGSSFARAAPFVEDVARGIAGLATKFMPGFNKALDDAGPILEALGRELPEIGDALGDMLADMAGSDGTLEGFIFLMDVIEGSLRAVGATLHFLGEVFENAIQAMRLHTDVLLIQFGKIPILGDKLREFKGHLDDLSVGQRNVVVATDDMTKAVRFFTPEARESTKILVEQAYTSMIAAAEFEHLRYMTEQAKLELARFNQEVEDAFNVEMTLDEATLRVQQGMLRLKDTLKENGKHWETNTEKGLANREALLSQVKALDGARQAMVTKAGSDTKAIDAINAKFNAQILVIMSMARTAGAGKDVLNDLAGSYLIDVKAPTVVTAKDKVNDLHTALNNLPSLKTLYVRTIYQEFRQGERSSTGRQHGGDVLPHHTYQWQEKRPEVLVMGAQKGHVFPSVDAYKKAMGNGGGGGPTYNLTINAGMGSDPREIQREIMRAIQGYESSNGRRWRTP